MNAGELQSFGLLSCAAKPETRDVWMDDNKTVAMMLLKVPRHKHEHLFTCNYIPP